MTTTDDLLEQVKAGRYAGTYDPIRRQTREHDLPESIYRSRVELLEALAGVELTPAELLTLLWLLDWDGSANIASVIRKRCALECPA